MDKILYKLKKLYYDKQIIFSCSNLLNHHFYNLSILGIRYIMSCKSSYNKSTWYLYLLPYPLTKEILIKTLFLSSVIESDSLVIVCLNLA